MYARSIERYTYEPQDYPAPPDFLRHTCIKAAKLPHACTYCNGTIKPGEPYERWAYKQEGDLYIDRMCARCIDIEKYYREGPPNAAELEAGPELW